MDLTQPPFQVDDRVRIVTDIFGDCCPKGSEWYVTEVRDGTHVWWIGIDDGAPFLNPEDLELVERAS